MSINAVNTVKLNPAQTLNAKQHNVSFGKSQGDECKKDTFLSTTKGKLIAGAGAAAIVATTFLAFKSGGVKAAKSVLGEEGIKGTFKAIKALGSAMANSVKYFFDIGKVKTNQALQQIDYEEMMENFPAT